MLGFMFFKNFNICICDNYKLYNYYCFFKCILVKIDFMFIFLFVIDIYV